MKSFSSTFGQSNPSILKRHHFVALGWKQWHAIVSSCLMPRQYKSGKIAKATAHVKNKRKKIWEDTTEIKKEMVQARRHVSP